MADVCKKRSTSIIDNGEKERISRTIRPQIAVENEHRNTSERKRRDGYQEDKRGSLPCCEERVVDGGEDESYKIF